MLTGSYIRLQSKQVTKKYHYRAVISDKFNNLENNVGIMTNNKNADPPVQSIQTMFDLVEVIIENEGAGVTELSNHMELPKSTVYSHLRTLQSCGFLTNQDGKYHVNLKFLQYGGDIRRRIDIYPAAWSEVQDLALATGEHANLMIEEHGMGRYIYISEGKNSATLDTFTGMSVPLHATAEGKAILANLSEERLAEILNQQELIRFTDNTITDRETLQDELTRIRENGVATSDEERTLGVRGVAAAITDLDDSVHGAIGVSGPISRFQNESYNQEFPEIVLKKANIAQLNLVNM
jgi:DNA-binding IclR family transcriptional regulator